MNSLLSETSFISTQTLCDNTSISSTSSLFFFFFFFNGQFLNWKGMPFPFYFVMILSYCILLCNRSGQIVCIQSYVTDQWTCRIWINCRNLTTYDELIAFVCDSVRSRFQTTVFTSARTWNALILERWERQDLCVWERGTAFSPGTGANLCSSSR